MESFMGDLSSRSFLCAAAASIRRYSLGSWLSTRDTQVVENPSIFEGLLLDE